MIYLDFAYLPNYFKYLLINLWPLWLFVLSSIIVQYIYKLQKYQKLKKHTINQVDQMNGREFENYLEWMFTKLGYRTINIGDTSDFGGDLILTRDNSKIVIQAKRYNKPVGIAGIQEALGAKGYYQADEAIVVTNQSFTPAAKKLAEPNKIKLWDREILTDKISQAQKL